MHTRQGLLGDAPSIRVGSLVKRKSGGHFESKEKYRSVGTNLKVIQFWWVTSIDHWCNVAASAP